MFRVIIAGTRDFDNYELLKSYVDKMLINKRQQGERIIIVSGHCRGADLLGERYAHERGYVLDVYKPDWHTYGRKAGVLRNRQMAERADALIAFWDGSSRGTKNMIDEAIAHNLLVRVKRYK